MSNWLRQNPMRITVLAVSTSCFLVTCCNFQSSPTTPCTSDIRHPTWEKGHQLWRSLNAVIILRQQMRQADDPAYAELLARIRIHAPTAEDIELLRSRIGAPLPQFCYVPIIVRRNTLRHAMNDRKLCLMSEITQTLITYCVADVINKSGMSM